MPRLHLSREKIVAANHNLVLRLIAAGKVRSLSEAHDTCWACGLRWHRPDGRGWTARCHVQARANLGGGSGTNLFLLCRLCHEQQPDGRPRDEQELWLLEHPAYHVLVVAELEQFILRIAGRLGRSPDSVKLATNSLGMRRLFVEAAQGSAADCPLTIRSNGLSALDRATCEALGTAGFDGECSEAEEESLLGDFFWCFAWADHRIQRNSLARYVQRSPLLGRRMPYGYAYAQLPDGAAELREVPHEQEVISAINTMFIGGDSIGTISEKLAQMGVKTRNRHPKFSKSYLWEILRRDPNLKRKRIERLSVLGVDVTQERQKHRRIKDPTSMSQAIGFIRDMTQRQESPEKTASMLNAMGYMASQGQSWTARMVEDAA
jgi:hypothetical protein